MASRPVTGELHVAAGVVGTAGVAYEALLLARQLPHLAALIDGQVPGIEPGTARGLAAGVLEVAQGHPKLLELADGQAARPQRLRALLDAAGDAWQEAGGLPEGFFATGETTATGADFLHVLGNLDSRRRCRAHPAGPGPVLPPATGVTLTRALTVIDPAAAAQQMEQVLAAAVERRDYETASATAGALVNYRQDAGQLGALWPAMPMGPLLGDIVAAATGDGAAAGRAQESLAELAAEPELGELAEALGRVLAGDRELGLAETLTDADARAAVVRAVVATVLAYVAG